jgi:hypothetical protein
MFLYSDLCTPEGEIIKRYWDFWCAQLACAELEEANVPYQLFMMAENLEVIRVITKFRIPKLQTSVH